MKIGRPSTLRRWASRLGDAGGVAAEFALLMPVFLSIIYGIVEFSQYGFTQMTLADAARSGARHASTHGSASPSPATSASVTTIVKNSATGLNPALITVTPTFVPNNAPGSVAQVVVTYPFIPLISGVIPALTITVRSYMVIVY